LIKIFDKKKHSLAIIRPRGDLTNAGKRTGFIEGSGICN
jgi:hypothetical protein